MKDSERADVSRRVVVESLRVLRPLVRRERRRQRWKRWSGSAYFLLEQLGAGPTRVSLAGVGVDPLWDTTTVGPDDLDLQRPMHVERRETLGQMWIFSHDQHDVRVPVVLVVSVDQRGLLVPHGGRQYPASGNGWRQMVDDVARRTAQPRGGRWHGIG